MNNKVSRLHPEQQTLQEGMSAIATVTQARDGEATTVKLTGQAIPVCGHFGEVPILKEGDRVAVMLTADGAVIMSRLRSQGEKPQPLILDENGRLLVEAAGGICLQSGESKIEITADGRIWVDGKEIYSISSGRMRLQGSTIELN